MLTSLLSSLLQPRHLRLLILIGAFLVGVADSLSIDDVITNSAKSRPRNDPKRPDDPLHVHIGFYLESIGNFRSTEMSFDVDLYVYMSWRDARLAHNRTSHVLVHDDSIRQQMWLPDLYFANARQAQFQDVTVPNFNMFVARDGTVAYSCRATCSISCSLQLVNYPMDKQRCYIRVLSYAHVADEVDVHWFSMNPIRYNPEIGLPEFAITNVTEGYCNGTYRYALTESSHKIGNFSCLVGNIFLSRSIGYNLVQSYIPTGLIVMISWVSFWIDRRAVPARVTLSFTTLVSLTTLGNGLRFGLPQVSYAKAIDLWFGACMFFVFCALLEFALINSYMRNAEKYDHISKTFATSPQLRSLYDRNVVHQYRRSKDTDDFEPSIYKLTDSARTPGSPPLRYRGGYERVQQNGGPKTSLATHDSNSNGRGLIAETRVDELVYGADLCEKTADREEHIAFVDDDSPGRGSAVERISQTSFYENVTPSTRRRRTPHKKYSSIFANGFTDSEDDYAVLATATASNGNGGASTNRNPRTGSHGGSSNGNGRPSNSGVRDTTRKKSVAGFQANTATYYACMSKTNSRFALKIDKVCRYLFPISFLLFNAIYWWYYLVHQNTPIEELYNRP